MRPKERPVSSSNWTGKILMFLPLSSFALPDSCLKIVEEERRKAIAKIPLGANFVAGWRFLHGKPDILDGGCLLGAGENHGSLQQVPGCHF